jgi:Trk K+ transport system NAD-binding subunit
MMEGHVVLCGLGKVAIATLEILHNLGVPVVVIAREIPTEWATRVERWSAGVVLDDDRDESALLEADLPTARALIIATDDDLGNLETALYACEIAPQVPVVLRLYDQQLGERARMRLPVRAVLNAGNVAAGTFVASVLGDERIRAIVSDQLAVAVEEHTVAEDESGLLPSDLAARLDGLPIVRVPKPTHENGAEPSQAGLQAGETLVVARGVQLADLDGQDERQTDRSRKSAWTRPRENPLRAALLLWRHASLAVRLTLAAFLAVIGVGVVVFRVSLGLSWLDSLYFTATIVTTVGFGDITLLGAPPGVKLFGIALMLSGAALLIVCLGIITDYLVSQRVDEALHRPRTTLTGHVIVAGLGNVGHKVALDLARLGRAVLAVDQRTDLRFTNVLGEAIPVLHGDASDELVMHQAGIAEAQAIAAVTDNDIVNLRIAELAKSLNPNIRTVVRLFSTRMVGRLGTVALGVDEALNPSLTAAATFAASALAPSVLCGFTYARRLLMLRKAGPQVLSRCVGMTVNAARVSGCATILFRRAAGDDSMHPARAEEIIEPDDEIIVLDEYCPQTGQVGLCALALECAAEGS